MVSMCTGGLSPCVISVTVYYCWLAYGAARVARRGAITIVNRSIVVTHIQIATRTQGNETTKATTEAGGNTGGDTHCGGATGTGLYSDYKLTSSRGNPAASPNPLLPMLKREANSLNRAGVLALPLPSNCSRNISRGGSELPKERRPPFLLGVGGPGRL